MSTDTSDNAIYLVTTMFRAAEWSRAAFSNSLLAIIDELHNIHGVNYGVGWGGVVGDVDLDDME